MAKGQPGFCSTSGFCFTSPRCPFPGEEASKQGFPGSWGSGVFVGISSSTRSAGGRSQVSPARVWGQSGVTLAAVTRHGAFPARSQHHREQDGSGPANGGDLGAARSPRCYWDRNRQIRSFSPPHNQPGCPRLTPRAAFCGIHKHLLFFPFSFFKIIKGFFPAAHWEQTPRWGN